MTVTDRIDMATGWDKIDIRNKYLQKLPSDEAIILGGIDYWLALHANHMDEKELKKLDGCLPLEDIMRIKLYQWERKDYVACIKKLVSKNLIKVKTSDFNPDYIFVTLNALRVWEDMLDG